LKSFYKDLPVARLRVNEVLRVYFPTFPTRTIAVAAIRAAKDGV
jgi:hypothetical protein